MTIDEKELEALRELCEEVKVLTEGSYTFIFMKKLRFPCGAESMQMNALLVPQEHTGYATRLFLERPLTNRGKSQNWQVHTILGDTWHTWSWKEVLPGRPLMHILSDHLNAFL